MIVFLHIPKTAGSSVNVILSRNFKPDEIYLATAGRRTNFEYYKHSLDNYLKLDSSKKNEIKVLRGHFPFPNEKSLKSGCRYFTFLRDPVDRIISEYHFVNEWEQHVFYKIKNISLEDYSLSNEFQYDNLQVRMLAGEKFLSYNADLDEALKVALKNISESFDFVGLQSRFAVSVNIMANVFKLDEVDVNLHYSFKTSRKNMDEYDPTLISKIREKNQYDMILIGIYEKMFDQFINIKNVPKSNSFFRKFFKLKV